MRDRARNSVIGRANKALGDDFESWITVQHESAGRLGILAHVAKNEPKAQIVGGVLVYTGRGVADFTGTLEGGRSLAVEAKSTRSDRLAKKEVKPKQQEHLECVARAGGLALLLVEFRKDAEPYRARYAVPWLEVPWIVLRTAESVREADIDRWKIAECYLQKFHAGGARSSVQVGAARGRVYRRE